MDLTGSSLPPSLTWCWFDPSCATVKVRGFSHLRAESDGLMAQLLEFAKQQMPSRKAGHLCIDLLWLFSMELALRAENYCCQCREMEGSNCISGRCFCAAISRNRKVKMPIPV